MSEPGQSQDADRSCASDVQFLVLFTFVMYKLWNTFKWTLSAVCSAEALWFESQRYFKARNTFSSPTFMSNVAKSEANKRGKASLISFYTSFLGNKFIDCVRGRWGVHWGPVLFRWRCGWRSPAITDEKDLIKWGQAWRKGGENGGSLVVRAGECSNSLWEVFCFRRMLHPALLIRFCF